MNPLIWIPVLIVVVSCSAYTSYRSNQDPRPLWIFLNWCAWALPTWTIVTVYSKNIVFDGIIYDIVAIITFAIVASFLMGKNGFHFSFAQIVGILLMISGIVVFRIFE